MAEGNRGPDGARHGPGKATPPGLATPAVSTLREKGRKRRGSLQHLQYPLASPVRVPIPDFRSAAPFSPRWHTASRRQVSPPRRYSLRPRKLTAQQEAAIRALTGSKSLRSLAAECGVSHETIRAILRAGGRSH